MNTTNTGLTLFSQNTTELFKDEAKVAELAKPSLIASASVLTDILKSFKQVIRVNTSIPILESIKIEITPNGATFTGSDLETTVTKTVKLPTTGTGSLCLPYKLLSDYVSRCKSGNIVIRFSDLTNFRAEILRDTSVFGLQGYDPNEYPNAPVIENVVCPLTIQPTALLTLIDKALPFVGKDEIRPVMSGIKLEIVDSEVRSIATDAHKLAVYRLFQSSDTYVKHIDSDTDILVPILPCKVIQALLKGVNGLVKVETSEGYIRLSFGTTVITARQTDGRYPAYAAVIPSDNSNELTVNRTELIGAIKRVQMGSNKSTNQFKLSLNGVCHLSACDLDFNSETTETVRDFKFLGEPIEIGFNSKFILEVLTRIDSERVTVLLKEPNRAALLLPHEISATDDYLTLIMPVLIKEDSPKSEEVEEIEETEE